MKGMPTSLVLVLVVSMFFGVFALLGSIGSCFGTLSMAAQPTYTLPAQIDGSFTMLMDRAMWVSVAGLVIAVLCQIPVGLTLLGGAGLVVYHDPRGPKVMRMGLWLGPALEIVYLIFGLGSQAAMYGPTMELLAMSTAGQPVPEWFGYLPVGMGILTGVLLLISFAWTLIKLALYAYAHRSLSSPSAQAWLDEHCVAL